MSFNKDRIFIVDDVAPEWLHKSWLKKMEDAQSKIKVLEEQLETLG